MIIRHFSHSTCHRSEQALPFGKPGINAFPRQDGFQTVTVYGTAPSHGWDGISGWVTPCLALRLPTC